ncbi:flagellar biosynthesis protein FlhF [Bacillus infantis]|uniref:flagellar biosynthesis protein FlhF n=1 Tax=Bacillus infantis TaxID=324767 RepID=UPI003CE8889C
MKVKKFTANTMNEAMDLVSKELGKDAVILNSKIVETSGFLGFFKKKKVELFAGIDTMNRIEQPKQKEKFHLEAKFRGPNAAIPKKQFANMEKIGSAPAIQYSSGEFRIPEPLAEIKNKLFNQGFAPELIQPLLDKLMGKWYTENGMDTETLREWLKEALIFSLDRMNFGGTDFSKKFIHIVGPTGVGKTTTIAKLAAESIMKYNKKTAFITTDTYRIAAVEQLRTYAQILNIPLEVCYTPEDYREASERLAGYDVILVDTAGRNFRNSEYVEELKELFDLEAQTETLLVLSLASKFEDMEEIFKQFSLLGIDRLIFTKLDETATYGSMYNMMAKHKIGAAYMTNGQNVPDDLLEASASLTANILIGAMMKE